MAVIAIIAAYLYRNKLIASHRIVSCESLAIASAQTASLWIGKMSLNQYIHMQSLLEGRIVER